MVKAIWVEELDQIKGTEILKNELTSHGYKLPSDRLVDLLKRRRVDERIINKLRSRKVCVVGSHQTPTMMAVGTMKLSNEYGFYFSILKTRSEGYPEIRLIIENEQEFENWFDCFARELSLYPIENSDMQPKQKGSVPSSEHEMQIRELSKDFREMNKLLEKILYAQFGIEDKKWLDAIATIELGFSQAIDFIGEAKGIIKSTTKPGLLTNEDIEKILDY